MLNTGEVLILYAIWFPLAWGLAYILFKASK